MKLSDRHFERLVDRAIERIPAEIRDHLENILISFQDRPTAELLEEMGSPPDEPLLGVYTGVSMPERSVIDPPLLPDSIILFKENIEEMCRNIRELEEEIEITVVHEVAHALGMSEERLEELGYQ